MKALLVGLIALAACNGCAGWQETVDTGLNYAHQAGVAARETGSDLIDTKCLAEAQKCIARGITRPSDCPAYEKCDQVRDYIAKALIALQMAVLDGKAALAVGDQKGADAAAAKAIALADQIRKQLAELGVI